MINNANSKSSNRNGLFMKVIIGSLVAGLAGASAGLIKLYGEVQVLKAGTQLEQRVGAVEAEVRRIGLEQATRTSRIGRLEDDMRRCRCQ